MSNKNTQTWSKQGWLQPLCFHHVWVCPLETCSAFKWQSLCGHSQKVPTVSAPSSCLLWLRAHSYRMQLESGQSVLIGHVRLSTCFISIAKEKLMIALTHFLNKQLFVSDRGRNTLTVYVECHYPCHHPPWWCNMSPYYHKRMIISSFIVHRSKQLLK